MALQQYPFISSEVCRLEFWLRLKSRHQLRASLVVHWIRIHQCREHRFNPWSGKIQHALEQLSPCASTTEPLCSNYWCLRALKPTDCNYWTPVLQLLKPVHLEPVLGNETSDCNEKLCTTTKSGPSSTLGRIQFLEVITWAPHFLSCCQVGVL